MIFDVVNIPLLVLGFIWIIGAILQDFKRREVDNLWNFSLIAFALAYRLAVSIYIWDYVFFINGVFGFLIFLILGNALYYGRVFAGGDAKLLIALGTVLPLSYDWAINFRIFIGFTFLFLIGGAIYVFVWALVLMMIHFRDFRLEFVKQVKNYRGVFYASFILVIGVLMFSLIVGENIWMILSFAIISFPLLLVFAKSIEEVCMIRSTPPKKVTLGDWLYKDIKIGGKVIRANWEGVNEEELELIFKKGKKDILVKQGVPFTPGFLIGLILLLWIVKKGMFGF